MKIEELTPQPKDKVHFKLVSFKSVPKKNRLLCAYNI